MISKYYFSVCAGSKSDNKRLIENNIMGFHTIRYLTASKILPQSIDSLCHGFLNIWLNSTFSEHSGHESFFPTIVQPWRQSS